MQCRSLVLRILQFAVDEGATDSNPVRKVPSPRRRADPEQVLDQAKRRALTPEEAGRLLAQFPLFWWDHVLCLLGTGLRFGELAGLRRRRVHLDRPLPVLQVVDTRYQAGRFGSGFKPRPKSDAGIRELPLAPLVVEAIGRQLPPGSDPSALVFTGPGGGPGRHVHAQVELLRSLLGTIAELDAAIATRVATYPRAQLLAALPGVGTINLAQLLAEVGPVLDRVANAEHAAAECGAAPVTKASGKTTGKTSGVYFRWAANRRARKALTAFAHNARMQSPWAGRLYADARARGKRNPHATRIVARAWLRVIWACWHTGTPYDPHAHLAEQRLAAA